MAASQHRERPVWFRSELLKKHGCKEAKCHRLLLLRDAQKVVENLRAGTFDDLVAVHSPSWRRDLPKELPAAVSCPSTPNPGKPASPVHSVRRSTEPPFDYPTPASFPPVTIMKPEPVLPARLDPAAAAEPGANPAANPERRRQAREPNQNAEPKRPPKAVEEPKRPPKAVEEPAPKHSDVAPDDHQSQGIAEKRSDFGDRHRAD